MRWMYGNWNRVLHKSTANERTTNLLPVVISLALLASSAGANAQVSAPAPGEILKDVERALPNWPITSPSGVQIETPETQAPKNAASNERVTVRGWRITGNTAFDQNTLRSVIADRIGDLSIADLNATAEKLTVYYRTHGYPLARAYVPKQQIEDGVITIAVLEGRYDRVEVNNASRVNDERVTRTIEGAICDGGDRCEGSPIKYRTLERGLMVLNDTPGTRAAARLSPGTEVGTSTLKVDATEDRPVSGAVQFDNGGNYYSGVARAIGTLWVNSPTRIGDQITLQGVASAIHGDLYYGAVGYGVPLGYSGARLNVRGSFLRYDLGDRYSSLDVHGKVVSGDATLSYPFIRSRAITLTGSVTYGERHFHDYVDAIDADSERRIRHRAEAALNSDFRDELFGVLAFNTASVVYAQGDLHLDSTLAAVDVLSAHSAGHYSKWDFFYARLQPVVYRTSLYFRVTAQKAADNLDAYEKFALGGPDAVRAYPAGETLSDEALLYSVELRQGFSLGALRALEGVLFYDRAHGDINNSPWANTANRVTLSGVGAGINCALTERITLRSSVAVRDNRRATAAPDHPYQYWLSLNTAF